MRAKSGGGIASKQHVKTPVQVGKAHKDKVSPAGVSQIGTAVDPKAVEPLVRGGVKHPDLGNYLALNVGKGGPGAGRTVMHCGSQGTHGLMRASESPSPSKVTGHDILRDYGPDKSRA
jgi:hypothetical protein